MGGRGRGRRPLRDAAVTIVGHEVAANLLFYFLTVSLVQIVIRLLKRIKVWTYWPFKSHRFLLF